MAKRAFFTEEELEDMRRADEEIEEEFHLTREDIRRSRILDREATIDKLDNRGKQRAEYQAAYYEANKDKIAERQAAYYEANKDKIAEYQAAYREANKDKIAERQAAYYEANKDRIRESRRGYMREYMRKRRAAAKEKATLSGANTESGKAMMTP